MLRPLTHRESAEYIATIEYASELVNECKGGWYYTLMSFAQGIARRQILPASKRSQSLITKVLKESTRKFDEAMNREL
jgi:hypothetical protein